MEIDTTNMCSHLKRKLFDEDGEYHDILKALQEDSGLTAVVRNRQLHIYRNGTKIMILAGKASPKVLRCDDLCRLIQSPPPVKSADTLETSIFPNDVIPQDVVCSQHLRGFFEQHIGKSFHFKAEFQEWLHNNAGKTFKDAVEAYHILEHPKGIQPQFEYNQYVRDFFADNKGATLKDAIRCWRWKKLQQGSHRYEKTDLDAVKR